MLNHKAPSSIIDLIGYGVYTPSEAAYYAEIAFGSVYRWLYQTTRTESIVTPELGDKKRIVTFLDFVQLYIVDRARERGVSLQKIRKAIRRSEDEGMDFPLARKEVVLVFDREIHTGDSEEDAEQFTGTYPGQMLLHEIAQPYVDRIEFNPQGFAQRFTLHTAYDREIWMDPRFEFGTPIVGTTGTPFFVLANAATAEGSVDRAAKAYGVDEQDIRIAQALRDRLDAA